MADIELVIKIPEKAYEYAKRYNTSPIMALREMNMCMNAVANGTPLDDIKAEIEKDSLSDVNGSKFIFVKRVNEILDKHIGGKA